MRTELPLLIAEDDEEDRILIQDAWEENSFSNELIFAVDGQEAIDRLLGRGKYKDRQKFPTPGLALIDLKMPKRSGIEVLQECRSHREGRMIPKVMLTTSGQKEEIEEAYQFNASSYIVKPFSFDGWVNLFKVIGEYWLRTVELPVAYQ